RTQGGGSVSAASAQRAQASGEEHARHHSGDHDPDPRDCARPALREGGPRAADRVDGEGHDLLIDRSWSNAGLEEVVARALQAFCPAQLSISGDDLEISPRQTLALSMALHELA